ncbi:helix-turn-helix domain-containing protein [Longispora sp. K20-0274]|uniref:TrmB family transcriptional regulator n=1 Tax=Longispora sp. K20-0274 TaxID=3088255 RepID=UPI00399B92B7
MVDELGLNELLTLGLTRYEARVYLALIRRDRFTPTEAAREAGIPRQRIYDVLESLADRGLVRLRPGQTVHYSAIDPVVALEHLVSAHRASLSRLEHQAHQLGQELGKVWSTGAEQTDPLDYVEVVRDPSAVVERFAGLQAGARRQILTLAKLPYVTGTNPPGVGDIRRLVEGGGEARCIYERASLADPAHVANAHRFMAAGERARVLDEVPMKLCVVDGSQVLMSLLDPVAGYASSTSIMIEHPALGFCLVEAFEALWSRAEEFPSQP